MFGGTLIHLPPGFLTKSMKAAVADASKMKSFRAFPHFWQTFLWSWGGFLLKDRLAAEYESLARETDVSVDEVPIALEFFEKLFPNDGGWFRGPVSDSRRVLMLMPAAMRGVGAFRRLATYGTTEYRDLGFKDNTTGRMASDNNVGAKLLDCNDADLLK